MSAAFLHRGALIRITLLWAGLRLPLLLAPAPGGGAALWTRLSAAAADLGVAWLVYFMLDRMAGPRPQALLERRSFWAGVAAAAFPLNALFSAAQGQGEAWALLLLLGAAWFMEFSRHPRSDAAAALSLALAGSLRPWTLFLLPLFLGQVVNRRERLRFAALAALAPLGLLLWRLRQGGPGEAWGTLGRAPSGAFGLGESVRSAFAAAGGLEEAAASLRFGLGLASALALAAFFALALAPRRRLPLIPGLSLGALTLYGFLPEPPLPCLAWLAVLALLLPGKLALFHGLAAMVLALQPFGQELLRAGLAGEPARAALLAWSALTLALWVFHLSQWKRMLSWCLRPQGRLWVEP